MYMTKEIMDWLLAQQPPHPGFAFRVHENEFGIWLTVSLEEFAKFSQSRQEDLAMWMGFLCSSIRKRGVPCYIDRQDREVVYNETEELESQ